jgi:hypothetical protein
MHITKDITALTILGPRLRRKLHIVNVYNEVATDTLQDLDRAIGGLDPNDKLIILGDFNLHHPLWSIRHRRANMGLTAAQPLLTIIKNYSL